MSEIVEQRLAESLIPPFVEYSGQKSFFGGVPPLSQASGYAVLIGFGLAFSIFTTFIVWFDKMLKGNASMTSEHFK